MNLLRRPLLPFLLGSLLLPLDAWAARSSAPRERAKAPVLEAAPVLVTTEGESTSWSSVPELIAAAEKGDARAAFQYAQLLENGDQVARDPARALLFYRRSAEGKHADALFRLGKIHHDGLLGVSVDYRQAIDHYRAAAAAGVPEAMYNLGAMLVSARGVRRDYVAGLAWLLVAEQHGASAEGGVEQVRQRLARRPDQIAAAEQRAQVLAEQLQKGEVPTLNATPLTPPAARVGPPPPPTLPAAQAPVTVDRPAANPALPPPALTLEQPSWQLPAPPPPPAPAAEPQG
jgi:uncharacterized protein